MGYFNSVANLNFSVFRASPPHSVLNRWLGIRTLVNSCWLPVFWLCHKMSDSLEFLKPWPCIKLVSWSCWRHRPECCPDKSLPVFLEVWKPGEVQCVTCICTCMQPPQLLLLLLSARELPFIYHHCFQTLPKGRLPAVRFAKVGTMCLKKGALELRSLWTLLARDWSCSQSCAQAEFNA